MNHKLRFLKFGLVGVANTALDFAVFVFLVRALYWDLIPANIVAYLFAVTNSYVLNRTWTFRDAGAPGASLLSYTKFVAINSVGLVIGTVIIYLLKPMMSLEIAKLLSIFVTLVWNYFGTRYFVFHGRK